MGAGQAHLTRPLYTGGWRRGGSCPRQQAAPRCMGLRGVSLHMLRVAPPWALLLLGLLAVRRGAVQGQAEALHREHQVVPAPQVVLQSAGQMFVALQGTRGVPTHQSLLSTAGPRPEGATNPRLGSAYQDSTRAFSSQPACPGKPAQHPPPCPAARRASCRIATSWQGWTAPQRPPESPGSGARSPAPCRGGACRWGQELMRS